MIETLKIGIIEQDEKLLDRYKNYSNSSEFSECILAVNSLDKFLKFYRDFMNLDCILLGINCSSNLIFIKKIKQVIPKVNVIIISSISNAETVYKSLRLGAIGYLLQNLSKAEFERQLSSIQNGGVAVSPTIARTILEYFAPSKVHSSLNNDNLSKKEIQIVNFLLEGLTYNKISETLNISINGVRYHVKKIYKKLGINSRAEIHNKYLNT